MTTEEKIARLEKELSELKAEIKQEQTEDDMPCAGDIYHMITSKGTIALYEWSDCADCIFYRKGDCSEDRLEWLQQEYKASEVDWSKVEIDTPISVRDNEDEEWKERYFAGYLKGKILAFADKTSSKSYASIYPWNYAKLAEQEDD